MKYSYIQNRHCPVCAGKKIKKLQLVNNIDIVRCKECKMVFADVDNSEIDEKNSYTHESFYRYLAKEPVYTSAYYDLILEKIIKKTEKKAIKILEFGCGPGFFLRRAKLKNIEAYGCDFSEYSNLAKDIFDLNITVNNIFDAGYDNEQFDVIYTHATHEHLGDMSEISKKLYELLKPGGLFVISGVPNYRTIPVLLFSNFRNNEPPSHVNFFEKDTIKNFYKTLGLKTLQVKSYGFSTWMWIIVIKLKQLFSVLKPTEVQSRQRITEPPQDPKITKTHRFVAYIYSILHIPGMGRNIEIWGRKIR